mmetsp:Transcript_13579/g.17888  ORF Transcript_13579/g.17888 Transcript_13579/m.17888 type:complete len:405 (+) Transcript_13579:324-1538(+)
MPKSKAFGPHRKKAACSLKQVLGSFLLVLVGMMGVVWWHAFRSEMVEETREHMEMMTEAKENKKTSKKDSNPVGKLRDQAKHMHSEVNKMLDQRKHSNRGKDLTQMKERVAWAHGHDYKLHKTEQIPEVATGDGNCKGGTVFLTYAMHKDRNDDFCRFLDSAISNKVPIHILGWNHDNNDPRYHLKEILHEVERLPPTCTVIYTDPFSTVFQQEAKIMTQKLGALDTHILFPAECDCQPFVTTNNALCWHKYPESPTKYRYLGSKLWAGTASKLVPLLTEALELMDSNSKLKFQEVASEYYIHQQFPIKLDHNTAIFQPTGQTNLPDLPYCNPIDDLEVQEGYWTNTMTKDTPSILQLTSRSHSEAEIMETIWFRHKPSKHKTKGILFESSVKIFSDICTFYTT